MSYGDKIYHTADTPTNLVGRYYYVVYIVSGSVIDCRSIKLLIPEDVKSKYEYIHSTLANNLSNEEFIIVSWQLYD